MKSGGSEDYKVVTKKGDDDDDDRETLLTEEDFEQPNVLLIPDAERDAEATTSKAHYHAVFGRAHLWTQLERLHVVDSYVNVQPAFKGGGTQQLEGMSDVFIVATRLTPQDHATVERHVNDESRRVGTFLPKSTSGKRPGNVVMGRWSANAKAVYADPPQHMRLADQNPVEMHDRLNVPIDARARLALVGMDGNPFWHPTSTTFDLPCVLTANGHYLAVTNARGSPMQIFRLGLKPKALWVRHLYDELGDRYRITRLIMTEHYLIALMVVSDCPTPAMRLWRFDSTDKQFKDPHPMDYVVTVNDFILRVAEYPETNGAHLILGLWSGRVAIVPVQPKSKLYVVPKHQVMDTVAPVTRLYVPRKGPLCYAITAMGVQVLLIPPPEEHHSPNPKGDAECYVSNNSTRKDLEGHSLPITRLGTIYLPSVAHICTHKGVIVLVTHDARTCVSVVGNFEFQELPALAQRARYALDQKPNYGSTCDRAIHMDDERIIIAFPNGAVRTIKLK